MSRRFISGIVKGLSEVAAVARPAASGQHFALLPTCIKGYSFASSLDGNGNHISYLSREIYRAYILHKTARLIRKNE